MTWRPKDWYRITTYLWMPDGKHVTQPAASAIYELGADAMLDAIKRLSIPPCELISFSRWATTKESDIREEGVWYKGIKGTLVFIPDS